MQKTIFFKYLIARFFILQGFFLFHYLVDTPIPNYKGVKFVIGGQKPEFQADRAMESDANEPTFI